MALVSNLSPAPQNQSTTQKGAFDRRLVTVGLNLPAGPLLLNEIAIFARGQKFGSANQNQCNITIFNLTREQRNYILSQASPLLQPGKSSLTPINMTLDVGRESYGTFRLFEGNVLACNVTQPPDIGVILESLTSNVFLSDIISVTQPAIQTLQTICQAVAKANNLTLQFEVTNNRQIDNFSFTGGAGNLIKKLNAIGGIIATVDNSVLLVVDADKARKGDVRIISESTGMVGIPEVTEYGCIVRLMIDNTIELLGSVEVQSQMNPSANGKYKVIKIAFDISNRDQPFWYTLMCSNLLIFQGTQ